MVRLRDVNILQEDFKQIYYFQLRQMEWRESQEETYNNFSEEFASEVSIHLLLVFQFWHSWQIYLLWPTAFFVIAKVSAYLLR